MSINLAFPQDTCDANAALARFMALPQGPRIQAEYIWIGGR